MAEHDEQAAKSEGEIFDEPRIAINRVYTRHGDAGETRLVFGQRVAKHDPRIEAYGTIDELNAVVGCARRTAADLAARSPGSGAMPALERALLRVQHELFNLGSILATLPEDVHPKQPRVTAEDVAALEREMDACGAELAPLRSFVLPGGSRLEAELHVARTVCRRAERRMTELRAASGEGSVDVVSLAYVNRLSDAFFVWSRWAAHLEGAEETLWSPNESAAAKAGSGS